jgi:hypothetical protein
MATTTGNAPLPRALSESDWPNRKVGQAHIFAFSFVVTHCRYPQLAVAGFDQPAIRIAEFNQSPEL